MLFIFPKKTYISRKKTVVVGLVAIAAEDPGGQRGGGLLPLHPDSHPLGQVCMLL